MRAVSTCPASSKPRGARVAVWRVTHAWPSLFVICYAYAGEAPDPGPVCRVRCVCVP